MTITQTIVEVADELIAFAVTGAAIACAGYIVYTTGEIPEYLPMGFGIIITFYYTKNKK